MPTGYTADIRNGMSFKEYALRCARNFGALIMMMDQPFDSPIPDSFEPSDYHSKALDEANKEMDLFAKASPEELEALSEAAYQQSVEYYDRAMLEKKQTLLSYEAMLEKARAYVPPTDAHVEYGKFLVSQIEESIKYDCDMSCPQMPARISGVAYKEMKLSKLRDDVKYHSKELEKEIERSEKRTEWVIALKTSIQD